MLTIKERVEKTANLFLTSERATIRSIAAETGFSYTTVLRDITVRLQNIDPESYRQIQIKLQLNKEMATTRGGIATRRKFEELWEHRSRLHEEV